MTKKICLDAKKLWNIFATLPAYIPTSIPTSRLRPKPRPTPAS